MHKLERSCFDKCFMCKKGTKDEGDKLGRWINDTIGDLVSFLVSHTRTMR